jgi:hypothetical protein
MNEMTASPLLRETFPLAGRDGVVQPDADEVVADVDQHVLDAK